MKRSRTARSVTTRTRVLPFLPFLLLLSACASTSLQVVPEVRSGLPALKSDVLLLYDAFTADPIDDGKVSAIQGEFARLQQLESAAGGNNASIATEIRLLLESFNDHVQLRRGGVWSTTTRDNSKRRMTDMFDTVIRSEQRAK